MNSIQQYRSRLALIVIVAAVGLVGWWGWVPDTLGQPVCARSSNGAWIGVEWTAEPIDDRAVADLARVAAERRIQFLFPFTTYVKADGSFSPSYTFARQFVAAFRAHNHHTKLLAWIGLPSQHIAFDDPDTRQQIVTFVSRLSSDAGFDGVHINAEPIANGDPAYLLFLEELDQGLAPGQMLSVASLPWMSSFEAALQPNHPYRWTSTYYRAVAEHVDQIVAMTYDSQMVTAGLYRVWMREQVVGIRQSITKRPLSLLIGVSLSREATMSHRPESETIASGLIGFCAGLAQHQTGLPAIDGVALYALWEATPDDWAIWQRWQHHAPSGKLTPEAGR